MFNYTYDELLARALGRVTSGMDVSEGSFLYDAITSTTQELYLAYLYCDEMETRLYADTSYDEYLERRCAERGISRESAVKSQRLATVTVSGETTLTSLIGTTWGIEDTTYTLISVYDNTTCVAQCTTSGTIGNRYSGAMINVDAVSGVVSVSLGETVIAGSDEETDDSLRERYFDSFNNSSFGGNIADYKEKIGELDGVGQVKVYPVYNGAGTVLIRILGNDNTIPSQVLIDTIQESVDPTDKTGQGYGLAPIGHTVSVLGASSVDITVTTTLTYKSGYSYDNVQSEVEAAVSDYITSSRDNWSEEDNIILRIAQIESRILDVSGIIDVTNTTINGAASNLRLATDEVPNYVGVTVS